MVICSLTIHFLTGFQGRYVWVFALNGAAMDNQTGLEE